ncbi:hypothetical protein EPI10_029115 [Gossypium australe]|uniref:Uncharacterized protein n=1 Tax=Gossypium australe TaxID=47621 RepID=A0A5B6V0I8_9ROSI|nr:hypothetical protein EPI10_029115 [Gossypium australe]
MVVDDARVHEIPSDAGGCKTPNSVPEGELTPLRTTKSKKIIRSGKSRCSMISMIMMSHFKLEQEFERITHLLIYLVMIMIGLKQEAEGVPSPFSIAKSKEKLEAKSQDVQNHLSTDIIGDVHDGIKTRGKPRLNYRACFIWLTTLLKLSQNELKRSLRLLIEFKPCKRSCNSLRRMKYGI